MNWVNLFSFEVHFIMAVWRSGSTCATNLAKRLTSFYPLSSPYFDGIHVGVQGFVTVAVGNNHAFAIAAVVFCFGDYPVASSLDGGTFGCGEVETIVHPGHFVHRVNPIPKARKQPNHFGQFV